jgi:hypothetical protein
MSEDVTPFPEDSPDALTEPDVDEIRDDEVSDEEVARSMPDASPSDQDPGSYLNPCDEIQSSSKKRKEHPVDMLANKTKTELLAEAHSAGIKGRPLS